MTKALEAARVAYQNWQDWALEQTPTACTEYITALEFELSRLATTQQEKRDTTDPICRKCASGEPNIPENCTCEPETKP